MLYQRLTGIYPVLPTALTQDEDLDEQGQQRVIEFLLQNGAHGLWVMGGGSEGGILSEQTRLKAIQITLETVAGRVPVIVGVGESGTLRTIDRIRCIERMAVDAISVTAPYYYMHSQEELLLHFKTILSETDLPLVLYNVPFNTKNPFSIESIQELAVHPQVVGIKDALGDFSFHLKILEQCKGLQFRVFQGWDNLLVPSVLAGADGAVLYLPVLDLALTFRAYDAAHKGDLKTAMAIQTELNSLIPLFGDTESSGIAAMKEALALRGLCNRTICKPFKSLTQEQAQKIKKALTARGLL